ncbi:zinc-binding dehydrogenase [Jatrophihabitans telluris]|uniref:Zinc-binding dehydrogenase n=1 Tax=Jatrophihabitans telluris TaxID=2038343 RepID=A0ABY4QW44_9ACTN|nr:zinc-binding dehydrogenase [Jatrophihabitans telluris]UQX87509.1 zinc-binding dehydrogenase [Jatrophihabitans telluris]
MRAAYATSFNPDAPLDGLELGERPEPEPMPGWTTVQVKATSLNHHDLWTLRGVGISEDRLPMILGCDAAGIDTATGKEVVVHSVISGDNWTGDETLDPTRSLLSERHQGTFAEYVRVPAANVIDKPAELSFAEAACLPTAWLTAYRMLFVNSSLRPGQSVLVQGASGGVASACISLARVAGLRVWATARTEAKQQAALDFGAHQAFPPGARLPERVDAVMETVGAATWSHSLKSLRPGGQVVISGATSGALPPAELNRIFFLQLQIIGSTMGTRAELADLMQLLRDTGLRPRIDRVLPLSDVGQALTAMQSGQLLGKIVLEP